MPKKYRSDIFAAIHETAEGLHDAGVLTKTTMREFDEACLQPAKKFTPEEIVALRKRERVSQPVFARYLNVSKNLISEWERGNKTPGGPAERLLTVIEKNGIRILA
ncbi:helix-turn-helix domain-containing protein [Pseudomonas luteola]|uniref:helix-turn-helix domain-containing protein n=1 Tax=Pseudomonas luteola TaxID=47886 RepID=UPI0015E3DB1F|nr:DNA-binding transcriptional regulator [Pseudomonas zeshuii]MBA1250965.1 DNA-binding transcriptional regulator [Pseudomonas zeshuii]